MMSRPTRISRWPSLRGAAKFGMFSFNQQAPLVLVGGIQQCQVDTIHFTFGRQSSEPLPLFVAHRTHPTRAFGGPPTGR